MKTAIVNGKLLTPFRCVENAGLLVEDGKILELFEGKLSVQKPGAGALSYVPELLK